MDWIWEYVDRYKHHPKSVPGLMWHEFVGAIERLGRFDLRERLLVADGISLGQPAQSEDYVAIRAMEREKLDRVAYPWRK